MLIYDKNFCFIEHKFIYEDCGKGWKDKKSLKLVFLNKFALFSFSELPSLSLFLNYLKMPSTIWNVDVQMIVWIQLKCSNASATAVAIFALVSEQR